MNAPTDDIYRTDADGSMLLAGHSVSELLETFGSPLIVMIEDQIRQNCRDYRQKLDDYPESRIYYASKAFLTTGFCRLIEQEGLGLDVASAGELATALAAGFNPENILMHGNAKSLHDLRLALESGIGRIVIDNSAEIESLNDLAGLLDCHPKVLIRVTPGIKPSTHEYVQTGQLDSKFGFNLEGGAAAEAVKRVVAKPNLDLVGLHCHIGSQIFSLEPFLVAAQTMLEFYARACNDLGAQLSELNMGGGLGISYTSDDQPPAIGDHIAGLSRVILAAAKELKIAPPILCDEPGRSIVGRAGVTLYTVQSTKKIDGIRNYASVDGGMTDNPRYALYQAKHQVVAAKRLNQPADSVWSISGRCCESGDMLARDVDLPELKVGDVLAILSTGAYTYSMASNYNRVARPAVVLAAPGRVDLLARREDDQDLTRLDQVPPWLAKTGKP
jgi:diaminopimelate decarboxylase